MRGEEETSRHHSSIFETTDVMRPLHRIWPIHPTHARPIAPLLIAMLLRDVLLLDMHLACIGLFSASDRHCTLRE